MDQLQFQQQQNSFPVVNQLGKKPISLLSLINVNKIDKIKIKEHFLENCSTIPQEFRLYIWKIFLGKLRHELLVSCSMSVCICEYS